MKVNQADEDGRTPFYIACEKGKTDVVKLPLGNSRINVKRPNLPRLSVFNLLYVAWGHFVEAVRLLLDTKRVDVNKATRDNWRPLDIAESKRHTDIVELLRQAGARGKYLL